MILIVDDTQENIFSLKKLLTLHHFPVDTAASGDEALKKIPTGACSLIILDVQMPDLDGFEVAEAISGLPYQLVETIFGIACHWTWAYNYPTAK